MGHLWAAAQTMDGDASAIMARWKKALRHEDDAIDAIAKELEREVARGYLPTFRPCPGWPRDPRRIQTPRETNALSPDWTKSRDDRRTPRSSEEDSPEARFSTTRCQRLSFQDSNHLPDSYSGATHGSSMARERM